MNCSALMVLLTLQGIYIIISKLRVFLAENRVWLFEKRPEVTQKKLRNWTEWFFLRSAVSTVRANANVEENYHVRFLPTHYCALSFPTVGNSIGCLSVSALLFFCHGGVSRKIHKCVHVWENQPSGSKYDFFWILPLHILKWSSGIFVKFQEFWLAVPDGQFSQKSQHLLLLLPGILSTFKGSSQ